MLKRAFFVCAFLAITSPVLGQTAQEKGAARTAAKEGVEAYESGDFERAVDRLRRAEQLVHAPTHLLFLARSYEKLGRLVEAKEAYQALIHERLPEGASQPFVDAQEAARREVEALEPRIATVAIEIEGAAASDVTITLDGAEFASAALGMNTPINPGTHIVEASAPGTSTERREFSVEEGKAASVRIELRPSSEGSSVSMEQNSSMTPEDSGGRAWQKPVGWAAIGLGSAGVAFGAVTGVLAIGKRSSLDDDGCVDTTCPNGVDVDGYNTLRTLSSIGLIAGAVTAATGTVLVLTAPKKARTASITPYLGFAIVGAKGTF